MSERDPQDVQVDREAQAAADEAGRIGGRAPDDEDPERRPVEEAGGGEAEGFEQAEEELRENAEQGQLSARDLSRDTFTPEEESDLSGAEYGEADDARTHDRPDED